MTEQEAIEQIAILKKFIGYDKDSVMVKRIFEGLDLAIQALKNEQRRLGLIEMVDNKLENIKALGLNFTIERWQAVKHYLEECEVKE